MKRIKHFDEYSAAYKMAETLLDKFESTINESEDKKDYKSIQDEEISKLKSGVSGDIKLNFSLVSTFGAGIGALYPVVDSLLTKSSMQVDTRSVVLLTIAAVSMIVLEQMQHMSGRITASELEEYKKLEKETQAVLEELKMAGFPNAKTGTKNGGTDNTVLGMVVDAIKSIFKIFSSIHRKIKDSKFSKFIKMSGATVFGGLTDMLAYTGMLIPIMNGINAMIGLYNMDLQSFISNSTLLLSSIGLILAKHGVSYLANKLKNFFDMSDQEKKDLKQEIEEIETPLIKKVGEPSFLGKPDTDGNLIKGQ
jgi:hypothetical protein